MRSNILPKINPEDFKRISDPGKQTFLGRVRHFKKEIHDLQLEIDSSPNTWQMHQEEVDALMDSAFNLCMDFELENFYDQEKVKKMKGLFIKHFRKYIRWGFLNRMVIDCPFGYMGDFNIIDFIYKNKTNSAGAERCLDNYFLETPAAVATRNRKEDFKNFIKEIIIQNKGDEPVFIMDVASGPCRDIYEIIESEEVFSKNFIIDCVEKDKQAIQHAKRLISKCSSRDSLRFFEFDVLRLALTHNIKRFFSDHYELIFSTGLFDYLEDRVAIRLIANLRNLLKPDGRLVISNYRDKFSNPSRFFMEWGGDWELKYRTEDQFLSLFEKAGFEKKSLSLKFEKQHIMQYCIAKNSC